MAGPNHGRLRWFAIGSRVAVVQIIFHFRFVIFHILHLLFAGTYFALLRVTSWIVRLAE